MSEVCTDLISVPEHWDKAPTLSTIFQMLLSSCSRYKENIAYIYRSGEEEHQVSYAKLFEDVLLLSRAFRRRGVTKGDKVMVLSDNRYAWIVTDLAIMSLGAINVPRGADTPSLELEFIITHSDALYLVVENAELLEYHNECLKGLKQLKSIFVMSGPSLHTLFSSTYSYLDLLDDRRYTQKDIEKFIQQGESISEQDLLTLIYTSGTTGMPKGVQLTHANVMHNVRVIPDIIGLTSNDSWLSILPSWHIFERTAEYVALAAGTTLVYSSVKTFAADLERYRPTLVATVPRVWESLYSRVQGTIRKKGAMAMRLFRTMIWASSVYRYNRRKVMNRLPCYSEGWIGQRVFEKGFAGLKMMLLAPLYLLARSKLSVVQKRFGGRLRLAISGGGTLATHLEEWIDAVGIRIVNAYGMTECSPAIAGRGVNCRVYGTLGPPVPHTQLRIVSENGAVLPPGEEGLIEVKGPQVTQGYYKNEEENQKSFSEDGFFKTGDLGKLTIGGELVITGRAKEIIVLASGENIDPTRIENTISMFPFVQDAILVGQDKKGLGALVVPNMEELLEYVGQKFSDLKKEKAELLEDRNVIDHIKKEMNRLLMPKQGFKPYEKLQNIAFLEKEFKLGEELTNTLKKKRHVIEKKYRELINELLH
ncbi:AMP-dependent synthetase/ligase [Desulfopila aestuarii]|uniref:Long-chain acyl-CoA synthetase n=1 Tax=Desulfopila aestuarii DSM 18488 TaxID=1121416 RepID=A0A1M7YHX0_9BACT|nr:AMP-binding protein [Desulfopila aestuarii]SHO52203.1 long-chain acyl-CoA synthetase [Desulfopila aestuarii DSM 18488]